MVSIDLICRSEIDDPSLSMCGLEYHSMDMVELNGIVEFRPPPERQLILTYELHRPRQILRHCSMYLESVLQSMWMDAQLHSALYVGTLMIICQLCQLYVFINIIPD